MSIFSSGKLITPTLDASHDAIQSAVLSSPVFGGPSSLVYMAYPTTDVNVRVLIQEAMLIV